MSHPVEAVGPTTWEPAGSGLKATWNDYHLRTWHRTDPELPWEWGVLHNGLRVAGGRARTREEACTAALEAASRLVPSRR
jgi:hypothetical protein